LKSLVHQPPNGAGIGFVLTDGTALFQGNSLSDWWKLTPDNTGSYLKGTWTKVGNLQAGYVPDAFSSAVLADGRVVIVGGEYNNNNFVLTNQGAIYDPVNDSWTSVAPPRFFVDLYPPRRAFAPHPIGDASSVVLPDGTVGEVRVTRSLDRKYGLDDAAVRAFKETRFSPGTKDGVAVPVLVSFEISFAMKR